MPPTACPRASRRSLVRRQHEIAHQRQKRTSGTYDRGSRFRGRSSRGGAVAEVRDREVAAELLAPSALPHGHASRDRHRSTPRSSREIPPAGRRRATGQDHRGRHPAQERSPNRSSGRPSPRASAHTRLHRLVVAGPRSRCAWRWDDRALVMVRQHEPAWSRAGPVPETSTRRPARRHRRRSRSACAWIRPPSERPSESGRRPPRRPTRRSRRALPRARARSRRESARQRRSRRGPRRDFRPRR